MRNRLLSLLTCLLALSLTHGAAAVPYLPDGPTNLAADVTVKASQITWQPRGMYERVLLAITGPEGLQLKRAFEPGSDPTLAYADGLLPDGNYLYKLTVLNAPDETGEIEPILFDDGVELTPYSTQVGAFAVEAGAFVEQATHAHQAFVLHAGNVTIDGSACVGNDCNTDPPSPTYGFDTLRLMENNLRILAMDTSGGSFPTRDWQIEFNSSSNGGPSYYMVRDCANTAATSSTCNGTAQFTIEAGADNDSIYIDSSGNQGGNVGFGTTNPAVDLDVLSGNTPTLRLQQDNSSGFGPQTWDVAGNEANFFIRDVTNGSSLPIRIEPGVASNTLYLDNQERIGIGTSSPASTLHIRDLVGDDGFIRLESPGPQMQLLDNDGTRGIRMFGNGGAIRLGYTNNTGANWTNVFEIAFNAPADAWVMDNGGNVTIANNLTVNGTFSNPSSIHLKENFAPVNAQQVLTKLSQIPVSTWTYINDEDGRLHMGPMAQDFWAAFGLGIGEEYLSPLDVNGVALAAIQALNEQVQAERARADALSTRLTELEQMVKELRSAQH